VNKTNKSTLGLMAVIDEGENWALAEWLHFHRLAGVDKFYLALRYDSAEKDTVTRDFLCTMPFVEDIVLVRRNDWHTKASAYQYVMEHYKDEVDWLILGDLDEFYFAPNGQNFKDVLQEFDHPNIGGVIVGWTQMGLCNFVDRPPLPITDRMVLAQSVQQQQQYKVVVRASAYTGCDADWYFNVSKPYVYQDGQVFDSFGQKLTTKPSDDKIKCHHYFVRGVQDLINRKQRYEGKEYQCDLLEALKWVHSWAEPNVDATLYSKELRKALDIPGYDATIDNTLFLSVADWEKPEEHIQWFDASARMHGVNIEWVSWQNQWEGFIQNKVIKVLEHLLQQKGKKYAFVLDSADVIFAKSVQEILDTFNRVYDGGVLFNCDYDGVMWPFFDPMLQWYISTNYGKNGIVNAGCYCGLITDIISLLEQILDVREQIINKDYKQLYTKLFAASQSCGYENKVYDSTGRLINDDQWVLHAMQTEYNPLIKTDRYKQIFALTNAIHNQSRSVYDRDCLGGAGILHIPHIIYH